ncbi:MAG: 2-oxo acid dehydrogenase subunit E2 [Bacteroidota bacterium]
MMELTLPSLGEGIEKGTIISILVNVGDTIEQEQPLMEVETDKVVVEVPADAAGVVTEIMASIGDEITEGTVFLSLSNNGEAVEKSIPEAPKVAAANTKKVTPEVVVSPPKEEVKTEAVQTVLKLPSLGEGIEKGTVIALHVKSGEVIEKEQALMEVETDKVVVEVPSDAAGTILEVMVNVGDEIGVDAPILSIRSSTAIPVEKTLPIEPPVAETNSTAKAPAAKPQNPSPIPAEPAPKPKANGSKYRSTPLARRLAREIGVDITQVQPQFARNRIGVKDVKHYAKTKNSQKTSGPAIMLPELPDFSKWGNVEVKDMSGIMQATSRNMTTAWSTIPHAWLQEKVDITQLEAKRQEHKQQIKEMGGALTMTCILVKVIAQALQKFPIFNASLDAEKQQIVFKDYVNIGIAVDSDRGLMVPVIKNANDKKLTEIALELSELSAKVRDKKITPEALEGGTFTISNLGGIGTSSIFPLVSHPQVAILGVAASTMEPVFIKDNFEPRLMMPITIGFDHRIINGADAARFLQHIKHLLQDWFLWNL